MKKKIMAFGIISMLLTIGFSTMSISASKTDVVTISGNTITVDDDGTGDYTSIQEAIDNANEGDTIFVKTGEYSEKLAINKNSLIIKGENKENTIINAADNGEGLVKISAKNVEITGFKFDDVLKNSGINRVCFDISEASNNNINNNIIEGFMYGVKLVNSDNNIINDNIFTGGGSTFGVYGIYFIEDSDGNTINDNYIKNYLVGIRINSEEHLSKAENNRIYSNDLFKNGQSAIDDGKSNIWNTDYPLGGNFYKEYKGGDIKEGVNQDENTDNNIGDGIGDEIFVILGTSESVDHYPLRSGEYPEIISISGSQKCKKTGDLVSKVYSYTIEAKDLQGDNICYNIDWGDGTYTPFSPIFWKDSWKTDQNPNGDGTLVIVPHEWRKTGRFTVKIKVCDDSGNGNLPKTDDDNNIHVSKTYTYDVVVTGWVTPKNSIHSLFSNFLTKFPILQKILNINIF
jgi:parallel beta-helix repeat protein